MKHVWVKSTLGHGELMCSRCYATNREALAIGARVCQPIVRRPQLRVIDGGKGKEEDRREK